MKKQIISTCALFSMASAMHASEDRVALFMEHDPYGFSVAIIAMSVVFMALIILFFCFKWSGKLLNRHQKRSNTKAVGQNIPPHNSTPKEEIRAIEKISGQPAEEEVAAAIGIALFLHQEGMHDTESNTLTIEHTPSTLWSGCGNSFRQEPTRKF